MNAADSVKHFNMIPSFLQFVPESENGGYQLTPLALASARGKLEMVEMLVEAKANVNYTSAVS